MSSLKQYTETSVLDAARERVSYTFDNFEKVYVSFSGGKDSSVMVHLVLEEAIKRKRKVGLLIIDLEAQYERTISHIDDIVSHYNEHIELFWVCLPLALRNAVSNFEPRWKCWDDDAREIWVREPPKKPGVITDPEFFPFFMDNMEFEEFMVLFGEWYSNGAKTACFVGIRCDESLNRFRTIASNSKTTHEGKRYTTLVSENLYNIYPVYDWRTEDIWRFHWKYPSLMHNEIYDLMHQAGLTPHQMRLCQPYGDDQRRGLWLFHVLEPQTWVKVVSRVNGANSGALYVEENGNIMGYNKIHKPEGHTWKTFCELLLQTLPPSTKEHYIPIFRKWLISWKQRGYQNGIPDEAPKVLENKMWAPSYRRLCKCILRNDWWCKGLGLTQPKSDAYGRYLEIKKERLTT